MFHKLKPIFHLKPFFLFNGMACRQLEKLASKACKLQQHKLYQGFAVRQWFMYGKQYGNILLLS